MNNISKTTKPFLSDIFLGVLISFDADIGGLINCRCVCLYNTAPEEGPTATVEEEEPIIEE